MDFKEALQKLGIEEYSERILKSNSRGELFHLQQYIIMAECFGGTTWFVGWFKNVIKQAEENWKRPESVFQHIATTLEDHIAISKETT